MQVIKTDLFGVLREKLGTNLHGFIEDKVFPVAGDIDCDCLGINSELKDEMFREIDIIVNSAATTRFDERYIKNEIVFLKLERKTLFHIFADMILQLGPMYWVPCMFSIFPSSVQNL